MSDRASVIAALSEYANKPATSRDIRADPSELFSQPPLTTLIQFARGVGSQAELNALLAEVAPLIRGELFRGSALALSCGTLVEWGGDPGAVFPHLLAELPRQLALTRRAFDQSDLAPAALFDADPDAAKAAAGIRYVMLATMAVICRKAESRQALRANADIVEGVEAIREHQGEANFVGQVLGFVDDLDLIVLAPKEGKGFRVRCDAVATCAHLFTLLQGALIAGGHLAGEAVDEEVIAVATGAAPHERLLSDHARFHFVTWPCSLDNGFDTIIAMPVEETPLCVPALDGQRIVLVGPPLLGGRAWDSNFFANIHDALKSRAEVVEVLPAAEVRRWLDRIEGAKKR